MKVFAYCASSLKKSVAKASGVKQPFTSPPLDITIIQPTWLEGFDFIYFKLHGLPKQAFWYGDSYVTALSADLIRQADLSNTVIFAVNCHLPQSPMLQALFDAGAPAVVCGPGKNYAWASHVDGADIMGQALRVLMSTGVGIEIAYETARLRTQGRLLLSTIRHKQIKNKARLRRVKEQIQALQDTMEFRLFKRP